jgi:phenylpropionate dioxygenase-like ring-hydroxylating dioxygenase large terminal subunit
MIQHPEGIGRVPGTRLESPSTGREDDMLDAHNPDPQALVRPGAVHSSVYTDPAVFEMELDRLFGRAWLLIGHETQVPNPGDFVTTRIGREPILICRTKAGELRAFYNRCRHRGAKLCMMPQGNTTRLMCPYHAWIYDLDGALQTMPLAEEYGDDFDWDAHALRHVARFESYRGFLFASLAEDGPDLLDWLGHIRSSIDDLVDRAPAGSVTVAGKPLRHRYKGNWKFTFENLNDTLHAGVAHAIAAKAAMGVAARVENPEQHHALGMMVANAKPASDFQALDMVTAPGGHSYFGAHMPPDYAGSTAEGYFGVLTRAKGEEEARRILSVQRHVTLVYPGSTWHGRYQTVRMVIPLRVDLTEVVTMVFRLDGAPEDTFGSALSYGNNSSSALSSVITDDLEIYEAAHRMCRTRVAEWLPISRAMGEMRAQEDGWQRHPGTSEAYIRNQYDAWAAALASPPPSAAAEAAQ